MWCVDSNAVILNWNAICIITHQSTWWFPPNTIRDNNVVITSKRRHFDVITSKWHRFGVITTLLLSNVSAGLPDDGMVPIHLQPSSPAPVCINPAPIRNAPVQRNIDHRILFHWGQDGGISNGEVARISAIIICLRSVWSCRYDKSGPPEKPRASDPLQ